MNLEKQIYDIILVDDKFHLGCPCDIDCPSGCDGCANSICECSVS